ncbi:DUF4097 family beta strand repeat-containing protein [Actinokineospora iranica]|uniref:DUF4097 and DUF4098 domain-containing protein YvlB n=1 Tax=Actinokineospora iranica TaxID=1271860 RepID=A0A1G6JY06_9PSEU|nr:DUF4097 family beta strand repeat-containing protein [Actinokineospora iranica]SDC23669.1 DUF4097 and DUF4098 domain-containing protein YvlB [Actinokineospora iranica]
MPIFDTPDPISVTLELGVGDVRITATDRTDTVVEVRPSDDSDDSDVQAARRTTVEFANGTLLVRTPKARALDFSRKSRSVAVAIELPTGSRVHGDAVMADFHCVGALGECGLKTSAGHIRLDRTRSAHVTTGAGNLTVDQAEGEVEATTGTGRIRLGAVDGPVVAKNSNGHTEIGTATGEVRVRSANGDISVDRAIVGADLKTSNGGIRVGEVVCGAVVLKTGTGDLDVGVAEGTAAWLDLDTGHGRVRNSLDDTAAGPDGADETVEVRAHTSFGDITIRRS